MSQRSLFSHASGNIFYEAIQQFALTILLEFHKETWYHPKKWEAEAMAVRIIIDRKVKKGKESDFAKMLRELRSKAIPSKGYISGETLRAQNDPQNYVVITTWQSVEEWRVWERNPERKKIQAKIEKWMARPTKTKIYSYA
jgi:heme-degrading monooxygenase HmoA